MRIQWYAILMAILAFEGNLHGENKPGVYQLLSNTERANQIVHGRLDSNGKLTIDRVLKGNWNGKDPIRINRGKELFQSLKEACSQPGSIEVVVYLTEKRNEAWELLGFREGVVFFHHEDVYLIIQEGKFYKETRPSIHPNWKRTKFLEVVQQMIASDERCKKLLAQRPSAERIHDLVSLTQNQSEDYLFYYLHTIQQKVPILGKEEEQALLELFQKSDFPVRIDLLLPLFKLTPKSQKAFDTACIYLDYQHSREIRQTAIDALIAIDRPQAQIKLAEYLTVAEPEIVKILYALESESTFEQNSRLVEPILAFTQAVRQLHALDNQIRIDESYVLLGLIEKMGHPKMIPLLADWAIANDHVTNLRGQIILQFLLEVEWTDKPHEKAKAWLEKAKPFLEIDYDLKTPKGLNQWFDAYQKADLATRKILLRVWAFEKTINTQALFDAAKKEETAEAAKAALQILWKHERIDNLDPKIIEKFPPPEVRELPLPRIRTNSGEKR